MEMLCDGPCENLSIKMLSAMTEIFRDSVMQSLGIFFICNLNGSIKTIK